MTSDSTPKGALPKTISDLAELLQKLPGIGPRNALLAAIAIARDEAGAQQDLGRAILMAQSATRRCSNCEGITDRETCRVCGDPAREQAVICVVEHDEDARAIEAQGAFRGTYHVLHGALEPLRGIGPSQLTLTSLMERARSIGNNPLAEIILATSTTIEGDMTADFVAKWLRSEEPTLQITRLGRGLADRSQIEFVDPTTMRAAYENRDGEGWPVPDGPP